MVQPLMRRLLRTLFLLELPYHEKKSGYDTSRPFGASDRQYLRISAVKVPEHPFDKDLILRDDRVTRISTPSQ